MGDDPAVQRSISMYGGIKELRWRDERFPGTTATMFSPPSSLYADLGRFLRNRRTRVGLLAVLTFALIYHFNEQTRGRVSQTWLPNAFNNLGSVGPRVDPNQELPDRHSRATKVHASCHLDLQHRDSVCERA